MKLAIPTVVLVLLLAVVGTVPSHAQQDTAPVTITLETDSDRYVLGESVMISGSVSRVVSLANQVEFVDVTVRGPDYLEAISILPDHLLGFETSVSLHPARADAGNYTVTASYGGATQELGLVVVDPIEPEQRVPLTVSADRLAYVPNQRVNIQVSADQLISGETLRITIRDPLGSLVYEETQIPKANPNGLEGMQSSTSFHINRADLISGIYVIDAAYTGLAASTQVELRNAVDRTIALSAGGGMYSPGQTVHVTGSVVYSDFDPIMVKVTYVNTATDRSAGTPRMYLSDVIQAADDGSFDYKFAIPPGPKGLGQYTVKVSTSAESGTLVVPVTDGLVSPGTLDVSLALSTDGAVYRAGQTVLAYGRVADTVAGVEHVDLLLYRVSDPTRNLLPAGSNASLDGSGLFAGELRLDPKIFPGEYWLRASYHGGLLASDRFLVVAGDSGEPEIHAHLDRRVYGPGDQVVIAGIHDSSDGQAVHYTVTAPDGDVFYFRSAVEGAEFAATWGTPAANDAVYGEYMLVMRIQETHKAAVFEVSENPDGGPVPPLTVGSRESIYKSGGVLVVEGTAQDSNRMVSGVPERVRVAVDFGSGIDPFVSFVFLDDGYYEAEFPLPTNIIPEGTYTIRASYGEHAAETRFSIADLPGDGGSELLVSLDGDLYHPGDVVPVSASLAGLAYVEFFDVSVIYESGADAVCGPSICGSQIASVSIPAGADGAFRLKYALSESEPLGRYEVLVDAGYTNSSALFEVVPRPVDIPIPEPDPQVQDAIPPETVPEPGDDLPVPVPATPIAERFSRISDSLIAIGVQERMDGGIGYAPHEITGLLVTAGYGPSGITALSSGGLCVIGSGDDCAIRKPTTGAGSTVRIGDADYIVEYGKAGIRIGTFTISPANSAAIDDSTWIVNVSGGNQPTRFYYTVTYLPVP